MNGLFQLWDLKEYGKPSVDALTLQNGFDWEVDNIGACQECMLVTARAKYIGQAPMISFSLWVAWEDEQDELLYRSSAYSFGSPLEFRNQQWRVPPMFERRIKTRIHVQIPEGTQVILRDFHNSYDTYVKDWNGGIRFNAHLGFYGLAPFNTMDAYELAARCGFPACIVNPRVTKDGVFVCLHDETINDTARDAQGNPPQDPLYVRDMTYEELLQWDFGIHKSKLYQGAKIPKLEDFFLLCAKTGMRPMFSTHLKMSTEQWKEIRLMLKKLGLLQLLHVKSFKLDILEDAYSVLGDEIEGYTWDEGNVEQFGKSTVIQSKKRLVIERWWQWTTEEMVRADREAGFESAVYDMGNCSGKVYDKFIGWGVTEFAEDYHCSMGLNW